MATLRDRFSETLAIDSTPDDPIEEALR